MDDTFYKFSAVRLDGTAQQFSAYRGKVVLIVNVASKCGFTPQYEGLQKLYLQNCERGLEVLGFPCNQFGAQEPGSATEIDNFCKTNYGISFPLFAKVDVNGENSHPLFVWLKKQSPGLFGSKNIKWNFTKFLVNQNGKVVKRFSPHVTPDKISEHVANLLRF